MDSLRALILAFWPTMLLAMFTIALMTALELLTQRDRQSFTGRLPGLIFWSIWTPVAALVFAGFNWIWARTGIQPLVVLPLSFGWAGVAAIVAAPLAGAIVSDFFFYWFHRAQHRWLWRFHAVHHSIRDVNTVNAYHHITEPLFQSILMMLPASLIYADTRIELPLAALILHLQSAYIHSPTALEWAPLRVLFVDNRFHRIHHSIEERHFDRNFGAITTLWDRLFGTAHFPAPQEWPDTGIAGVEQPRSLRQWLILPWRATSSEPAGPAPISEPEIARAI